MLAATELTYSLADSDGSGSPAASDLEGFGAAIYFVDRARQDDPIGEYNLTDDECVVISAPATVLPLRLTASGEVMEAVPFTIEVTSEDLDENGNVVSEPGDMVSLMEAGRVIHSGPAEGVFNAEPPRRYGGAVVR